jgi:tetratricopeptide (TPR) repeat protein
MKNTTLIIVTLLLTSNLCLAQQVKSVSFALEHTIPFKGDKVFLPDAKNLGKTNQSLIDEAIQKEFRNVFKHFSATPFKGAVNFNVWSLKPLFTETTNKEDAGTIIGISFEESINELKEEKLYYEKGTFPGGAVPYYETKQTNSSSIRVIIDYRYSDKSTHCDTLFAFKESASKEGKKLKSADALLSECKTEIINELSKQLDFITREDIWYKFKSVKTSDTELKEALKQIESQIASGDIKTPGRTFRSIFEADKQNKEAAYNTGICYELLGNYRKAQEYYEYLPDFHTKVRMKASISLLEYLEQTGANLAIEDF